MPGRRGYSAKRRRTTFMPLYGGKNKAPYYRANTVRGRAGNMRMAIARAPELKYLDQVFPSTTVTAGGIAVAGDGPSPASLMQIAQNNTATGRIGRIAKVFSLQLNTTLIASAGGALSTNQGVRMLVVEDKQANKAIAPLALILDLADPTIAAFNAQTLLTNQKRFTILKDTKYNLKSAPQWNDTLAQFECPKVVLNPICKLKWKNGKVFEYEGTAGVIGEMTTRNIVCYFIRDAADDRSVAVNVSWRLRFSG